VLERRIRCKLIIGSKKSDDRNCGEHKTIPINGEKSHAQGNGEQAATPMVGQKPRDGDTEPLIGCELAEEVAALEDALELSSLTQEKRTSILADIKKLIAEAGMGKGGGRTQSAASNPWLDLPQLKGGRKDMPCFRHLPNSLSNK